MAIDAFLKFEGLGGEGQKLGNDFDRLGDSFTDLGGAFIKLVGDIPSADVKIANADFAAHIKHDVFTIGADFHKIGDAFIKLAGPLDTFADAVIKFTDQFTQPTFDSGEPLSLKADFLAYENDLKVTGADFLAAASDIKSDTPTESLSFNFNKISVDYKEQGNDALQIATGLAEFVRINKLSDSPVGEAFLKFSEDWKVVAADYLQLGADFQTISTDSVAVEGRKVKLSEIVFDHSTDFVQLNQDLKLTDADVTALGGGLHKLADVIENAAPVTSPSFKLG